ncbi:hypothetical protein I4U23_000742 [Adineta vaga]|nr:hypothetical protein I4U23_000742 [Adineta vaga]
MNDESIDDCILLSQDPTLIPRSVEMMKGDDPAFVVDEISSIVKSTIERVIGGKTYEHNQVNRWSADIVDQTLTELTNLKKPFKYIVHAVLMQKNGAGIHTASSCFWDNTTDGSCTVRWENKYVYAIVSVFGLSNY